MSRLRRTFAYPADNDNETSDLDDTTLDEQSQLHLLSTLSQSSIKTNEFYVRAFTFLPLFTISAFIYYMLSWNAGGSVRGSVRILCLLAMTSLIATGFWMWFVPFTKYGSGFERGNDGEDGEFEMNDYDFDDGGVQVHLARMKVRRIPLLDVEIDEDGPLGRVLPYLNVGICGLLALAGGLIWLKGSKGGNGEGNKGIPDGFWAFCFLPGVILGIVYVARSSMREVEEGIGELGGLRYGLKGA